MSIHRIKKIPIPIPIDVIFYILKLLPIKDLLRFKCVSKDWFSLINNPYFIKLHLKESMDTNQDNVVNIIVKELSESRRLLYTSFDYVNLDDNLRELNHPLKFQRAGWTTEVMGSCNGLLLLVNESIIDETYNRIMTIVLWNMSTGDYKVLPYEPVKLPVLWPGNWNGYEQPINYGFGYDSINDDYKVVRIVQQEISTHGEDIINSEVKVYSLKTNSWRRPEQVLPNNCFICSPEFWKRGGRFLRGALHWPVRHIKPDLNTCWIIAFDVETEKYHEIELPDDVKKINYMVLGVLGGCLSVLSSGWFDELWMMKDYGVKQQSWTLLFKIETCIIEFPLLYPIAFSKNYDKILLTSFWYHIQGQVFDVDAIIPQLENINPFYSEICIPSLVQLN